MRGGIVVAGHICLDMIPGLADRTDIPRLDPGKLVLAGPAVLSTGGVVSNTGVALHRLGSPVQLMGKVGDDLFGKVTLDILRSHGPKLADGMSIVPGETSSYTIVIALPGVDRMFLHCPGANDTFTAADIDFDRARGARIFHFGYPTLMRRIYEKQGDELLLIMQQAKRAGLLTSMDMTMPDPTSGGGRVDWPAVLRRVLPLVDVFLPSIEEIMVMIDRPRFDHWHSRGSLPITEAVDQKLLHEYAGRLIGMGVAVAGLKLGEHGLYLRTTEDSARLDALKLEPAQWCGKEIFIPSFKIQLANALAAGDCAIAGFLAGIDRGLGAEDALIAASAAGACCCERPDATSGVPDWESLQRRIGGGWERNPRTLRGSG